jgi:hypothetical protein
MRLLNTVFFAMAVSPVASAHTLDGNATLLDELSHQVSSGHHLVFLLAVIAAALVIRRVLRENNR